MSIMGNKKTSEREGLIYCSSGRSGGMNLPGK